ncbi:MAG TPA: PEP-CTERM sorting domain-containing protein [Rhodopila sp.]
MIVAASRFLLPVCAMLLALSPAARADPTLIAFTAMIGSGNNIDTGDVFGEGYGADLSGQIITGSISIDPTSLTQQCPSGGACYGDFGAGAVSVSFSLNGITSTVVSTGTLGYVGNSSGGLVSINDLANGGDNYLAVGAASPDGMVQQSIGVLFNNATSFSAYGDGDPAAAIGSLDSIGGGSGLVEGGITLMSPVEHLDATIMSIDVPEPAGLAVLAVGLIGLRIVRRKLTA